MSKVEQMDLGGLVTSLVDAGAHRKWLQIVKLAVSCIIRLLKSRNLSRIFAVGSCKSKRLRDFSWPKLLLYDEYDY